jgi:uncharacterized iron-regulated membrane protein
VSPERTRAPEPALADATPSSPTLRGSMSWLHTWAGVVLGAVLFAVFWMGTLSVFDREVDRWMMPGTRLAPAPPVSLDATVRPVAERLAGERSWFVILPTPRTPTLQLRYQDAGQRSVIRHIDPATGAEIAPQGTLGGSGFFFPFHFSLHLGWRQLGYWLVGLAGMAMLALLVSGVIVHRRLFKDLFTFRPGRSLARSSLNLHNLTGVLALPFHFVMTLSGLMIFFSIYFPGTWKAVYQGDGRAFAREVSGAHERPRANRPGTLTSLDAMVAEAERRWRGGKPYLVRVRNPGDAASLVEVRRSFAGEVEMNRDRIHFDGTSGAILRRFESGPVARVHRFLSGIHFVQFENWTLRWLYFLAGLAGCVMIGTGFIYWLQTRRARHAGQALPAVRTVEAIAVGSVTGIVVATFAFLVANRLLPSDPQIRGFPREQLEMGAFYLTWLATFVHAACRPGAAWREQGWAIGGLALAAPLLNWATTGDHVIRAIRQGRPAVAGMDLLLLAAATVALAAAHHLRRRRAAATSAPRASERTIWPASPAAEAAPGRAGVDGHFGSAG